MFSCRQERWKNMFIYPVSSNSFQAKPQLRTFRFSLQGRNATPMNIEVTGELGQKVTALKYKLGELERKYENKNGFSDERLANIIDEAQQYLKEGVDFLYEFIKAQKSSVFK